MNIDNAIARYKGYGRELTLIERDIGLPKGNFMNAIIGPRRAGKTFLMLLCKNKTDVPESNKIFINGEDVDFEGIRTDDLDEIEKAIFRIYSPDKSKDIHLFIDEVQNFPSWGRWMRTLFDQHLYKITVSGSTSDLSTDKLPSELRGRVINTLVLPFSFKEFCAAKKLDYGKYMQARTAGTLVSGFEEFLEFGGYPLVVSADTKDLKSLLLNELYETVLQRDLIEKYGIRKSSVLKSFINSMLGSTCRIVSARTMAKWLSSQGIEISPQNAFKYLSYAQNIFLFFFLYPYSRKPKERNTKPKLYLPDSGLMRFADQDTSKKLENQVFVELLRRKAKISYYATQNYEIDFVVWEGKSSSELIQVSYALNTSETYKRETESLIKASETLGCNKLSILTFNEEKELKIEGKTINVIPTWKWLLADVEKKGAGVVQ